MEQLPHRDPQDGAVDGGQPGQLPVLEVGLDGAVHPVEVVGDALDQRVRVGVHRRDGLVAGGELDPLVEQVGRIDIPRLRLEEQVNGPAAGFVPRAELLEGLLV